MNKSLVWGVVSLSLLLSSVGIVSAQGRPTGVASLAEMSCQGIESSRSPYGAINEDVSVGLEIFRAVARISAGRNRLDKYETRTVVCRLSSTSGKPTYKRLNLAFGLADNLEGKTRGSVMRLTVYQDGNPIGYKDVTRGKRIFWPIDVSTTRTIALEVQCINAQSSSCSPLFFFEDTLE